MPKRGPSSPAAGLPLEIIDVKGEDINGEPRQDAKKRRGQATSQRTGQACDRCRTRKMKCDASLGGCRPCLTNGTPCTTTDRITGHPTTRGELEAAKLHIRDLEAQLRSVGVEVKPFSNNVIPGTGTLLAWQHAQEAGESHEWTNDSRSRNIDGAILTEKPEHAPFLPSQSTDSDTLLLPNLTAGIAGDKYLGASTDNSFLSSDRGPKLNILGWEINIADFTSDDFNNPTDLQLQTVTPYNKSFRSFVATMFGLNPRIGKVDLPSREEGFGWANAYIGAINPFLPILHKLSFLSLLTRVYDEPDIEPSAAETVLVHMVFAYMIFQSATRNPETNASQVDMYNRANTHFHYCVGLLPELVSGHSLQDVQALTMIATYVRTFPKPEVSWIVANLTFTKAIELGLHKSARRWATATGDKDILQVEMRKRIFWSILVIHVTICGKQGRPMPIRLEDFDVEIPEPYDDELLTDAGSDTSRNGKCSFLVGIEAFKVAPIFIELYNEVYAAHRSDQNYIKSVRGLEYKLQQWREQWHVELRRAPTSNSPTQRIHTEYLNFWAAEFRLLLRHPSLSLTRSAEFNNENLEICMRVCHEMRECVQALQSLKSLDTTWYSCAVYVLAIQTTLYGHQRLKDELSAGQVISLRLDMEAWLSIMGDIGRLLGSGHRLQDTIREQVERSLAKLENHLAIKSASYKPSTPVNSMSRGDITENETGTSPRQENFSHSNGFHTYSDQNQAANGSSRSLNYLDPGLGDQGSHSYQTVHQYTYPEPPATNLATYPTIPSSYTNTPPYTTHLAAQALMQQQASVHNPNNIYVNAQPVSLSYGSATPYGADSQSWQQYTQGISFNTAPQGLASNVESQEYQPASALLQLGGRGDQGTKRANGSADGPGGLDSNTMGNGGGQLWPTILFDSGHGGV